MDQQRTMANVRSASLMMPRVTNVRSLYESNKVARYLSAECVSHLQQSSRVYTRDPVLQSWPASTVESLLTRPASSSTSPQHVLTASSKVSRPRNCNATDIEVSSNKYSELRPQNWSGNDLSLNGCIKEVEQTASLSENKAPSTKDAWSFSGQAFNSEKESRNRHINPCSAPFVVRQDFLKVIFRESLEQKCLQVKFDANFSETLVDYEIGLRCGDRFQPIPLVPRDYVTFPELVFSWKDIELVLKHGEGDVNLSSISDLVDIECLKNLHVELSVPVPHNSGIVGALAANYPTPIANENWSPSGERFSSFAAYQNHDYYSDHSHAKNVTSIPCDVKHVASKLGSSNASPSAASENNETWRKSKTDELVSWPRISKTSVESQENGVYLGRYPCLRDISVDLEHMPSTCNDSSSTNERGGSPDIIIRPRPYTPVDTGEDIHSKCKQEPFSFNQGTADAKAVTTSDIYGLEDRMTLTSSFPSELLPVLSGQTEEKWNVLSKGNIKTHPQKGISEVGGDPNSKGSEFFSEEIFTREASRKGLKNKPRTQPNHCLHLWEFLLNLLNNDEYSPKYIAWTRRDVGEFKLIRTEFIANLWGQSKKRKKMTYEKMARALRYYYKFNVLEKVPHKRLHFRFGKSILPRIQQQQPKS